MILNILFNSYGVIKTFLCRETEKIFQRGISKKFPGEIHARALMRLVQIDAAARVQDLRLPPSNHLEKLSGNREGQWSIRINAQWRIAFRFRDGDAFDVELVDYH